MEALESIGIVDQQYLTRAPFAFMNALPPKLKILISLERGILRRTLAWNGSKGHCTPTSAGVVPSGREVSYQGRYAFFTWQQHMRHTCNACYVSSQQTQKRDGHMNANTMRGARQKIGLGNGNAVQLRVDVHLKYKNPKDTGLPVFVHGHASAMKMDFWTFNLSSN